jgi:hypothetical protein
MDCARSQHCRSAEPLLFLVAVWSLSGSQYGKE